MIRLKSLLMEAATADSIAWAKKFKQDLDLTDEAAAAMAANIQHESGFIPDRIQGAGVKTGTLSQSGNLGYSWAQWTYGPRKENFREYIKSAFGVDLSKSPAQSKHAYAFLKHEVQDYPGFDFESFKKSRDVDTATADFVSKYEQAGKPMLGARQQIARDILSKLKPAVDNTEKQPEETSLKSKIYNKPVYVKKTADTDFVNVRNSPDVNNGFISNKIATVKYPNIVGIAKDAKTAGDYTWIWVELDPSVGVSDKGGWVVSKYVQMTKPTDSKSSPKNTYTVKPGETLSGIANRNKTTVDAILKKNKGLDPDKIQAGQKIII
jgi:LysM repeat protein